MLQPVRAVQLIVAPLDVIPVTAVKTRTGAKVAFTGGAHVNVNPFEGAILAFPVENNIEPLFGI